MRIQGFLLLNALLGCQPRGILSFYQDLITHKENTEYIKDSYSYVLDLGERIIYACVLARQYLEKSDEKSGAQTNKNRKLVKLRLNEKVLVLLSEKNNKLHI